MFSSEQDACSFDRDHIDGRDERDGKTVGACLRDCKRPQPYPWPCELLESFYSDSAGQEKGSEMNPCPCGYLGDPRHECTCSAVQIHKYESRLSGPLLDRIDLHLEVPAVPFHDLASMREGEISATIKARVMAAREIQKARFTHCRRRFSNSQLTPKEIKKHCQLDQTGQELLENAMRSLGLSARAYHRILKIARTIADLAAAPDIASNHVAEAIQYRRMQRRG